jgi:hypothetical protein
MKTTLVPVRVAEDRHANFGAVAECVAGATAFAGDGSVVAAQSPAMAAAPFAVEI